jgi:hypothetical protein
MSFLSFCNYLKKKKKKKKVLNRVRDMNSTTIHNIPKGHKGWYRQEGKKIKIVIAQNLSNGFLCSIAQKNRKKIK